MIVEVYLYFLILETVLPLSSAVCARALLCSKSNEENDFSKQIHVKYYLGQFNRPMFVQFYLDKVDEILSSIEPNKRLVLYFHGYREVSTDESVQTIVQAYLQSGKDNIVVVDWSGLAFDSYVAVACRVRRIGLVMARFVDQLFESGLDVKDLHIIGHSLGGQIAGFIGKYTIKPLSRITGLDPASPGFYRCNGDHLDPSDAGFVLVVHTDGGIYGALEPTGTVDFYPNGGSRPQPGCPLFGFPLTPSSLCSHWRSWRYYAESVINDKAFVAIKCNTYNEYLLGRCNENEYVYFGYPTPENVSGTYYFRTNSAYPYSNRIK